MRRVLSSLRLTSNLMMVTNLSNSLISHLTRRLWTLLYTHSLTSVSVSSLPK